MSATKDSDTIGAWFWATGMSQYHQVHDYTARRFPRVDRVLHRVAVHTLFAAPSSLTNLVEFVIRRNMIPEKVWGALDVLAPIAYTRFDVKDVLGKFNYRPCQQSQPIPT